MIAAISIGIITIIAVIMAMPASGDPPAALAMFELVGSRPSVSMWTVESRVSAT
jgi:hypothetical protein